MENIGQKKEFCEEKKIFMPKMASEKFKIQQKVFNKKMRNDMFKFS